MPPPWRGSGQMRISRSSRRGGRPIWRIWTWNSTNSLLLSKCFYKNSAPCVNESNISRMNSSLHDIQSDMQRLATQQNQIQQQNLIAQQQRQIQTLQQQQYQSMQSHQQQPMMQYTQQQYQQPIYQPPQQGGFGFALKLKKYNKNLVNTLT